MLFFSSTIGVLILQHLWARMNDRQSILDYILLNFIHEIFMRFNEPYKKAHEKNNLESMQRQNEMRRKKQEKREDEYYRERSELVNKMMINELSEYDRNSLKRDINFFNNNLKYNEKQQLLGLSITYYEPEKRQSKYAVIISVSHGEAGHVSDEVELFSNFLDAIKKFYSFEFSFVMKFLTNFILEEEKSKYVFDDEISLTVHLAKEYIDTLDEEEDSLEELFAHRYIGKALGSTYDYKYSQEKDNEDRSIKLPSPIPHPIHLIDLYNKKNPQLIKRIRYYENYFKTQ